MTRGLINARLDRIEKHLGLPVLTPPRPGGKPDETTTGPRTPPTRTITPAQAKAEAGTAAGCVGAIINGQIDLNGAEGDSWLFRDCEIRAGLYGVKAYMVQPFTGSVRPVLDHCEIIGTRDDAHPTSACVYGSDVKLSACHVYGGMDLFKPFHRVELDGCYAHGNHRPEGAHCDVVQITQGDGTLIHGCNLISVVEYGGGVGGTGNGVLQTGTMTGPITNCRWEDNWFDGGHYTIRLDGVPEGSWDDGYSFKRNRFGRLHQYGPVLGDRKNSTGGWRLDTSNVWDDTGVPV